MQPWVSTLCCVPGFSPESRDPLQGVHDLKDREGKAGSVPGPPTLWWQWPPQAGGGKDSMGIMTWPVHERWGEAAPSPTYQQTGKPASDRVITRGDSPVQPELQMVFT